MRVLFGCLAAIAHGQVAVTTLHWNSHRPCATDNADCVQRAQQRLAEMAAEVGASIVGAVEMKDSATAFEGWQSSGMQCDHSAVHVAPGWTVERSGGFCMNGDESKGFAVASVTPPSAIQGCPSLCVMMAHVPHGDGVNITGHEEVQRVCGDAASSCMIAMGDWNANDIGTRWESLIGGAPTLVEPHALTCCYPIGLLRYDHTATNIPGATSVGQKVYGFQLSAYGSANENEHKATSVQLQLPAASSVVAV